MHYTDTHGNPAEGDLWSPGPKMNTVWALTATGSIVVDTRTMSEIHYTAPDLGHPHSAEKVAAAHKLLDGFPKVGYPRRSEPRDDAEAAAVADARTVLRQRAAFDNDRHDRIARRSQRAPMTKAAWAKLVDARLAELAVPDLFTATKTFAA